MQNSDHHAKRHRAEAEPLGRPRTSRLPKPRAERAAQFMPFAALTGYFDLIREQEWKAQERFKKDRQREF